MSSPIFAKEYATDTALEVYGPSSPPPGGGSVTSVSVVSANGFAGTVANPTTTPAITLTTTITGILKGNGTAISAATPGSDYEVPLTFSPPLNRTVNTISIPVATSVANGYLSSADWTTFNSKQAALTIGNLTEATSAVLTITGGSGAIIGSGLTIQVKLATASVSGYLSSTDWSTFNGKQAAGNYITALTGDVTASGPGSVAATLATVNSNVGSFTYASITVNGKGLITAASSGSAPEVPLTFSTGLTRSVNTITANISTGVAGGQTAIGGTASGNALTLSSTSHATKGKILFGNSAYDEANNYLSLGQSTGVCQLDMLIPGTGVTQGQLVTWTYTGVASGATVLTACTYNLTNSHTGIGTHNFNAFKFNVTNNSVVAGSGLTLTFGVMDATCTEAAPWAGTGSIAPPVLSNIKSTFTDATRTISKNPQGAFGLTYVGFDAVQAGFGNTTFTTGSKTYNTIGIRSVTSLIPVAVSSGTPVFNAYACDLSVTGSTLGTSTSYILYLRKGQGADTNWGIFMNETTSTTNHKLTNDTQICYFGTGNDATLSFSGTQFLIQSDVVTSTDSLQIRGGTNGVIINIGSTAQITYTSLTGTLVDAFNYVYGSTTGTKFGTATSQKMGWYNATPIIQPGATTDLGTVLSNLGFRASGTAYPITTSGAITFGSLTAGRVPFAGTAGLLSDDADMTFATDTLTVTKIIGSTSIKVGSVAGYLSSDGSAGATGTFTTVDLKTVTVKDGIITAIV